MKKASSAILPNTLESFTVVKNRQLLREQACSSVVLFLFKTSPLLFVHTIDTTMKFYCQQKNTNRPN